MVLHYQSQAVFNMKNYKKINSGIIKAGVLLVASVILAFTACDKVKQPLIIKECKYETAHVTKSNVTTNSFKKVLLEDYTGHTCGNCPRAAETATTMLAKYKDSLVVIAIHAGTQFAPPVLPDYPEDFRTDAGTQWDSYFGMSAAGLPKGSVNRAQKPFPQPRTTWDALANSLLDGPQQAKILMTSSLDTVNLALNLEVKTTFLTNLNDSASLCVVVLEDSIIGPQKDYSPPSGVTVVNGDERPDYVFNHTLRGAVNGAWGDLLVAKPITANTEVVKTYCHNLDPWGDNIQEKRHKLKETVLVAIVYNSITRKVIQVEKLHIK